MKNRAPLMIVVALIVFLVYKSLSLYGELSREREMARKPPVTSFEVIERVPVEMMGPYGSIFDTAVKKVPTGTGSHDEQSGPDGGLTEVAVGKRVIRIQGIFMRAGGKYAVITVTDKTGNGGPEVFKVSEGQDAEGFRVTGIEPGSVHLSEISSQAEISLRIFRDDEI